MGIKATRKSFRYSILCLMFLLYTLKIDAHINNVGTPFINNYSRLDYNASQQNWMIDQGMDGRMYFANNDGLLEFDGLNWNLNFLPNEILVRSVFVSNDGKIYVGGFNEFGYFEPDSIGRLIYHSLLNLLEPEDRNFDEIWRIHNTPDGIVFQSFTQLIIVNKEEASVIKAPGEFHLSYFVNGQLYVVDLKRGIYRYSMGSFFPLLGTEFLTGTEVWTILPFGNKLLLATEGKGLFIYDGNQLVEWTNSAAEFLKVSQVYSAIRLDEDFLAFGTIHNGLLICTNEGRTIQKIDRIKGLQNNTILSLSKDLAGNLWLGTDNGIEYIEINSPLSTLSYEHGISAGYTAKKFKDILYLGTNQGVFFKKWEAFLSTDKNEKFKLIEATGGQVWTLEIIDDQLFCGNNNGTFILNGTEAEQISDIPGGWAYLKLPKYENKVIGGTYSGLVLFEKVGNTWSFAGKIKGFNESSRLLEVDVDGSLWMSHGFKGVYHLSLNEKLDSVKQVDFYNSSNGFQSDFGINVTRLNDEIYFNSSDGLYQYNAESDSFKRSKFLNEFQWNSLSKICEDQHGNIWYLANEDIGVLRKLEDGTFTKISLPFKRIKGNLIGGFEFVYPIDEENVLFGASHGFIHYNPNKYKDYQLPFTTFINNVSHFNLDSTVYSGHSSISNEYIPKLEFRNNALHFSFSANDFENPDKTEFSTFLEGYDEDWLGWEVRYSREFTNLYEGDYTFYVKARNIYGVETEAAVYKFQINPPWERTIVAFLIYAIFCLIIIAIILYLFKRKIERSKGQEKIRQQEKFKEREEKLQLETVEAEKEIIRLRNEKLREQMISKDKELANSTLDMIHKNKLLTRIKNDLKKISSSTMDDESKNNIQTLSKKINRELDTEKQWEVFETHFENVHEAFLTRLKTQYPDLSPRELKLCAYLRMNISSKEIAVLMNISTRGVEISRYRLRKKLSLNRNENLTDFILTF